MTDEFYKKAISINGDTYKYIIMVSKIVSITCRVEDDLHTTYVRYENGVDELFLDRESYEELVKLLMDKYNDR